MESISPETSARALRAAVAVEPLWVKAAGSSMEGTIADGDEVKLVSAVRPRLGEIWAYCDEGGRLVVHRFVGLRRGQMVFRGDARSSTDRLVPPARIAGKVTRLSSDGSVHRVRRIGGLRRIGRWKVEAAIKRLARRSESSR